MGFLDHSTNNIIIDAVLTDVGRQSLASNDGSFAIAKFAFGDDEVDYGQIQKFGRTVGKEKIIKNTPVLEGQTVGSLALKNRLISLADQGITKMPTLTTTGQNLQDSTSDSVKVLSLVKGESSTITITQTIVGENSIPVQLRDRAYFVLADSRFLTVNATPYNTIDSNYQGQLTVTANRTTTTKGGAVVDITIAAKQITDSQFTIFGNVADKTTLVTTIKLVGLQSGQVTPIQVQISKS
jgi:cyclophilin family peptidyl-prolyl cis-trans isomerase